MADDKSTDDASKVDAVKEDAEVKITVLKNRKDAQAFIGAKLKKKAAKKITKAKKAKK